MPPMPLLDSQFSPHSQSPADAELTLFTAFMADARHASNVPYEPMFMCSERLFFFGYTNPSHSSLKQPDTARATTTTVVIR